MRILCIGDIVGKPGRKALEHMLPGYVESHHVDAVVANAENAAGGSGLTPPLFDKLRGYGVTVVTMGDHVFRKGDIYPLLAESDAIVRPANLAPEAVGRTFTVVRVGQTPMAVFCLLGQMFMKPPADCPFRTADRVLQQLPPDVKVIVVDMHAEATSEKQAIAWHLAGRASIVFGTHTHVPTADEAVFANHTAYITDVGMTGPYDSILGRIKERVVSSMVTSMPQTFDVAANDVRLCGALVELDPATGAASSIKRVRLDLPGALA